MASARCTVQPSNNPPGSTWFQTERRSCAVMVIHIPISQPDQLTCRTWCKTFCVLSHTHTTTTHNRRKINFRNTNTETNRNYHARSTPHDPRPPFYHHTTLNALNSEQISLNQTYHCTNKDAKYWDKLQSVAAAAAASLLSAGSSPPSVSSRDAIARCWAVSGRQAKRHRFLMGAENSVVGGVPNMTIASTLNYANQVPCRAGQRSRDASSVTLQNKKTALTAGRNWNYASHAGLRLIKMIYAHQSGQHPAGVHRLTPAESVTSKEESENVRAVKTSMHPRLHADRLGLHLAHTRWRSGGTNSIWTERFPCGKVPLLPLSFGVKLVYWRGLDTVQSVHLVSAVIDCEWLILLFKFAKVLLISFLLCWVWEEEWADNMN